MAMIALRAGSLQMVFDDTSAFLRHVRLGDREIVRGIFAAVRDRNWNTIAAEVHARSVARADRAFEISFDAVVKADDIDFQWHGTLCGSEDGTVTFGFNGVANQSFLKNRIGICVLHPDEHCAGQPCTILHTDGSSTKGRFPKFISPHQPFKNIKSISHPATPETSVVVAFDGDVFEMEDQRNWTDASFKTYSTPLERPFPVRVEAGQRIVQKVTVSLSAAPPLQNSGRATDRQPRVAIDWSDRRTPPRLGFGMATTGQPLSGTAVELLAATAPDHLRFDLAFDTADWPLRLREASQLAAAVNARLHVALFLTDSAEQQLDRLLAELPQTPGIFGLWMIFHVAKKVTPSQWVELARKKILPWDERATFAAGTNAYFAELNRDRPEPRSPALPCYSINPQVHAFDNLSLIETLGAQCSTVETAAQFSKQPVVISPITLRPRFNPNATDLTADAIPESDPRQPTEFAAAWTAGSLARLTRCAGIHSVTYYETAGPRGIFGDDDRPFAMYHIFKTMAGCQFVHACRTNQPLLVDALALSQPDGHRVVMLASFAAERQIIALDGLDGEVRIRPLTARGFAEGVTAHATQGRLEIEVPGETASLIVGSSQSN